MFGEGLQVTDHSGRIQPDFCQPGFIQQLADCSSLLNDPHAEILHYGRNRVGVVLLNFSSQDRIEIVIKEFKVRGLARWKTLFLPSKAAKAWQGACQLKAAGLPTPDPIAYLEQRKFGMVKACYYLACKAEKGKEIRGFFLSAPQNLPAQLLPQLARFLASCHASGILHRDLSDGNILVEQNQPGRFVFCILDTNRIRARKRLNILQKIKNLIRLGVPPASQRSFVADYLGCPTAPPGLWAWYRLNKRTFSGYLALKKRLRLRKIAERLKLQ